MTEVNQEAETQTNEAEAQTEGEEQVGKGESTETPSEPELKYSQQDLDTMIADLKTEWDTKRQVHETQHADEMKSLREQIETQKQQSAEDELQKFLASVEAEGGDMGAAQRIVNEQRRLAKEAADLEKRRATVASDEAQRAGELKVLAAHKAIKDHKLAEDTYEKLMAATTPAEMETIALKLKLEAIEAGQKTTRTSTDKGAGTGKGIDMSKLTPEQRIAKSYEHGWV